MTESKSLAENLINHIIAMQRAKEVCDKKPGIYEHHEYLHVINNVPTLEIIILDCGHIERFEVDYAVGVLE